MQRMLKLSNKFKNSNAGGSDYKSGSIVFEDQEEFSED